MITGEVVRALFIGLVLGYFLRHIDAINKMRIRFGEWLRNRRDMQW